MCGIAGVYSLRGEPPGDEALLLRMAKEMEHRGPDDAGAFCEGPVSLAMRRLSIIDVSGGHQPLTTLDNAVTIVFNGEVFNFQELRTALEQKGRRFATRSDTEVVAQAFADDGTRSLSRLNGMFGFAVWDRRDRSLHVVRDRLGVKPIYYAVHEGRLIFASEIKVILAYPGFPRRVDPVALDDYFSFRYVPGPRTMFQGISKLLPGHYLRAQGSEVRAEKWWDVPLPTSTPHRSDAEWEEELTALLTDAVRLRMISDVPLGAFLSGGLDSSVVSALMKRSGSGPVKTYAIGFEGPKDESPYARAAAAAIGTEHHDQVVGIPDTGILPRLMWHLDEPIADPAVLPTYALARFARRHVTVALSGEGADELFAGYKKYRADAWIRLYRRVPAPLREKFLDRLLPRFLAGGHENHRLFLMSDSQRRLAWDDMVLPSWKARLYTPSFSESLAKRAPEARWWDDADYARLDGLSAMLLTDVKTSLADDLLMKVDKMTMAASLEARTPFLDYRVVEFAFRVPSRLKLTRGLRRDQNKNKVLLRNVAAKLLPESVVARKKHGFSVPIGTWFRGNLGTMLSRLLDDSQSDCLQSSGVREMIDTHRRGGADLSRELWAVLCFELWHRVMIEQRESSMDLLQVA